MKDNIYNNRYLMKLIFSRIPFQIILTVLAAVLFIAIIILANATTALHPEIPLGWSIVSAFIKSYIGVLLLYFCFRVGYTVTSVDTREEIPVLQRSMWAIIRGLHYIFLFAITSQIVCHLYYLWHQLGLYPIELGVWDSLWTLVRYCIGLVGTWVLELWFWIGKQLRISFLLNNPCFRGICLEEYPWISVLLTLMLGYVFKQLWKIPLVRGTVKFFFQMLYRIVRVIIKYLLKHVSKSAYAALDSSVLVLVSKSVWDDLKKLYAPPDNETREVASPNAQSI
ncbi:MAG: hypothetical protein AAF843_12775 [Bacteroidota bacterium]